MSGNTILTPDLGFVCRALIPPHKIPDSSARKPESRAARVSTVPLDPRFRGGRRKKHLFARVPRRRPHGLAEAGITHNDVDHLMIYDGPLFAARGKLCAPADLRPR